MLFSKPATLFVRGMIRSVVQNHPDSVARFIQELDAKRPALTPVHLLQYQQLLKSTLELEVFSKGIYTLPSEDLAALVEKVKPWTEPPPKRETPICCRTVYFAQVASELVLTHQALWPNETTSVMASLFEELRGNLDNGDFAKFKRLAAGHVAPFNLVRLLRTRGSAAEEAAFRRAYKLVDALRPDFTVADSVPPPPPSSPYPEIDSDLDEANARLAQIQFVSPETYHELTLAAYEKEYGKNGKNKLLRPCLVVYDHPRFGRLLVACSRSGLNDDGRPVYAGCKYGANNAQEVIDKKWDSVFEYVMDVQPGQPKDVIRAVPYVEGGYGKYWVNLVRERGDLLEFFFITKNGKVVSVDKDAYHRHREHIRNEAREPKPTARRPAPQRGEFRI